MRSGDLRALARSLAQPVTYLGLGMLVVIYCATTYLLIADRNANYDAAERRAGNVARIVDQSFSRMLTSVDTTLLFLRKLYQQNPSDFDLSAWVHDPSIGNKLVFDFSILDAGGRVIQSSLSTSVVGGDRSNQDGFDAHVGSAADALVITKPVMLQSRNRWAIGMSRRITAPDGTFAGVIVAFIDTNELGKQIRTLNLGPDGSVVLLGLDGALRVRAINGEIDQKSIGKQVPPGVGVLNRVERTRSGDYWNEGSNVDNITRLVSYRVLDSYPLLVVVGIAGAEVYRHANANARIYIGIALLLSAAIVAAMVLGAKREQKLIEATSEMKAAQEALQRSQERYQLVEDAVNAGIWDWNLLTGKIYRSPRWNSILGFADDELPGDCSSFADRLHPDDRAHFAAVQRAHLENDKPYVWDFRLRRKDGSYCWVQSRGKALRDAAGRPVRMVGTITDISERKQAHTLIEESRDNLARAETMALLGHYKWSFGTVRKSGRMAHIESSANHPIHLSLHRKLSWR